MKIFVSHAIKDKSLISKIKAMLEPHGLKLLIAEHQQSLEQTTTHKIEVMIKNCDVAIILLTKNGFSSKFVNQEIGYIQSIEKPYVQIVQIGLEKKIAGFNFGRDYISFDPLDSELALKKMTATLLDHWKKQQTLARQRMEKQIQEQNIRLRLQESMRLQARQKDNEAKTGLAILSGLLILGLLGGGK